ncbi:alpha-tubulin N-acetyltransferase 1 [Pieris rapae]|uniref:alpha-tubulin N-acetyltransferase 1 n=1 Tax=Pieris rapae TaxID=64459 RepID=UPI000B92C0C4|nr:alpha-tubulin N-acetyltransferase 1 [Pieris rapae]
MMNFTINTVLTEEVTKLDHVLSPADFQGTLSQKRLVQDYLKNVVNWIGEKSTLAQGLSKTLTSTDKLRNSEHILYLLKDAAGNNGQGQVIGILKIGVKSLYLYDESMKCLKVNPLCILDFYILEEYQKKGCGKKLFDYVLADQCTTVDHIAIDNPSLKFENFLHKHYNIGKLVRQPNCFAVSARFFENVQSMNGEKETKANQSSSKVSEAKYIEWPSSREVGPVSQGSSNDVTSYGTTSSKPTPSRFRNSNFNLKYSHNKLW